jgi:integrase
MARRDLSAVEVSRLLKRRVLGRHRVSDRLYLQIRDEGTGSWIYRYMLDGRPHHLGIGRVDLFTLAEARKRATIHGQQLTDKIDPLVVKRARLTAAKIAAAKNVTFLECATRFIEAKAPSWKSAKHAEQWHNTIHGTRRRPALTAAINNLSVGSIDTTLAMEVLKEIWTRIPETASRCRQRCEQIIDWATANKLRSGDNPFSWKGHLKHVLADPNALKKRKSKGSFAALPYADLPAFMAELRAKGSIAARALEFTILTAARTDEVRSAPWSEFDLAAKIWTVPPGRMKRDREHRVPLGERALQILSELPVVDDCVFNIEGQRLHHLVMLRALQAMRPRLTVHGFRSSFMDWAHERTAFPKVVIDMALAHAVGDKTEGAYRRGDLFAKRAELMRVWDAYCASTPSVDTTAGATVTPIRRQAS